VTDYYSQLTAHNDFVTETTGNRPCFFIRTYGCQMNSRDSENLAGLLIQMGYAKADSQENADLVVYNTCCVRESAENKIFGHLSRTKNIKETKRPNMIIAVGGCMSQQAEIAKDIQTRHPYIDIVFGTSNRHYLPDYIWTAIKTGKQVVDISEKVDLPEPDSALVTTRDYPHKAGVNIMYGCDNFCSFCIVPYVRGRERSRDYKDVLQEIEALAADGVKEIMLLGQNVNSYKSSDNVDFPTLLYHVNKIKHLERIRFMTSHPKDLSDNLIIAIRDLDKVCKSVHLPLQSGSTKVLTDMNRHYTQDMYLDITRRLQEAIPSIAITTDIIVGYPGETDQDFENTLDVVRKVRFSSAFTFIYSKRSGTPAAERTDIIPREISNQRFERLTATLYPIMEDINKNKIGKILPVMIEEVSNTTCKGRTDDNTLVHVICKEGTISPGQVVFVKIVLAKSFYVSGTCINIPPKDIQ